MSFYESDNSWSGPRRQPSWPQSAPQPPSRSSTSSSPSQHADANAFSSQFEEIDRATDNLLKSGKWLPSAASSASVPPGRRDSVPMTGRGFEPSTDPRMGGPSRHQSVSELDGNRPGSAGLQGFYAGQRFPGGRQSEAEQVLQAKRRMAAQRERELRNYHQEQQYNRTAVPGVKTDRAMSPTTMSEEDRRELIARQHRALYGDTASLYNSDNARSMSQDARLVGTARGQSPLAFDPFGVQGPSPNEGSVQMPPRERATSTASPASNQTSQQNFGLLSDTQQSSRTSVSSPGGSPPLTQGSKGTVGGVAPIGTRPAQGSSSAGGLSKRSTTPLTPSSLSYGFNASDAQGVSVGKDERSASSGSNSGLAEKNVSGLGSWGNNSGVWNSGKNSLAVQPSVWG